MKKFIKIIIILILLIFIYKLYNQNTYYNAISRDEQIILYCEKNNIECNISYEYSNDIEEGSLISYSSNNYVYSKGKEPVVEKYEITFGAIGDVILYDPKYYKLDSNGMYDFDYMFAPIKDKFNSYDVSMYVQESIAAGCIETYPTFCSPFEISDYMKDELSMDVVSMSNNHQLDQGITGLQSAIEYYESIEQDYIGAYSKDSQSQNPLIKEVNDVNIGYLSYATMYNGFTIDEESSYMISEYSEEKLKNDIEYLHENNVDVIISYIHWGEEYTYEPNSQQKEIAQEMADSGVDVIIGSHPHVLQPIEEITADDGTKTLVAYSLGNFTAAQQTYVENTAYGGILEFTIDVEKKGKETSTTYKDVNFYPTYNTDYHNGLITYPLVESKYSYMIDDVCSYMTGYDGMSCGN